MPHNDVGRGNGSVDRVSNPRHVVVARVRGYSMWPTLRSGQVLRAEYRNVRSLEPGAIVIVTHRQNGNTIVHRLMRILAESGDDTAVIKTCGDRSGPDEPITVCGNILTATHVLTRRNWVRLRARRSCRVFRILPVQVCRLMQSAVARIFGLVERRRAYGK